MAIAICLSLSKNRSYCSFFSRVGNAHPTFIINSRLKSLMKQRLELDKYIINVSSAEGRFTDKNKSWRHPHTNMASDKEYSIGKLFKNYHEVTW